MRFLTTEMQIRHALHRFLFDYELHQAKLRGEAPDQQTVQTLVQRCKDFTVEIDGLLEDEMDVWVQEFRQNLAEIDKAAKANAQAVNLSALNVTVSNGHQCEQAWELSIDNGPPTKHAGKTAAIAGLTPGQHTARVIGIIKGKTLQAEAAFSATGGRAESIALTLG